MKKMVSLFLLAAILGSICIPGGGASAETSTAELDQKIQEAEQEKEKAEKHIKQLEEELAALEDDKDDILKYVKKVDKKMEQVSETLKTLNKQVSAARKELSALEEEVEIAEAAEKEQYETMKRRIKYMYENGGDDYKDVIFSATSLSDLLTRSEYIEKISEYDNSLFDKYVQTKEDAEMRRTELRIKIAQIASLQEETAADKAALKELKESKNTEVGRLNDQISSRDEKVQLFQEQVAKQEQEVENLLLAKQRSIAQQEQAAAASGTMPQGDAYANTGQLRWPLQVPGRISSGFGARTSPTEGASTDHHGIDIAVPAGTPIVASADGTVVTATYSASAGNYIMLYHGNSLYTVYMHASSLAVGEGAEVKQGDVIAYVGSTGISTGAHLHFGISINGQYVNPLNYVSQ